MSDTETQLKAAIVRALRTAYGSRIKCLRMPAGRVRNAVHGVEAGTPDILVVASAKSATFAGRVVPVVIWLEIKLPTGKVSPEQLAWIGWARDHGHRAYVVRTVREAIERVSEAMR